MNARQERFVREYARCGVLHRTPFDNPNLPADYQATLDAMTGVQRRRMRDGI